MTALVTSPPATVDQLVEIVGRECRLAIEAAGSAVEHAARAGVALLEIKERVDGSWAEWCYRVLEPATGINYGATFTYMRLARHNDLLPEGVDGLAEAMSILAVLAPAQRKYPYELRDEAQRLLKKGRPYKEVSALLGVPQGTLAAWVNAPTKAERAREARQALLEKETRERANKLTGDVAKCYSLVRLLAQQLDRACDTHEPRAGVRQSELYDALAQAQDGLYKVEDLIGKAVRLS